MFHLSEAQFLEPMHALENHFFEFSLFFPEYASTVKRCKEVKSSAGAVSELPLECHDNYDGSGLKDVETVLSPFLW